MEFKIKAKVEQFPGKGGWVHIQVPKEISEEIGSGGYVSIMATVGKSTWKTALMPIGTGFQLIALKAAVRKAENINVGDKIRVSFRLLI